MEIVKTTPAGWEHGCGILTQKCLTCGVDRCDLSKFRQGPQMHAHQHYFCEECSESNNRLLFALNITHRESAEKHFSERFDLVESILEQRLKGGEVRSVEHPDWTYIE